MASIEELKNIMEKGLKNGKYVRLEVSPGIWIDADEFRETGDGILFMRKGYGCGFVHKDIFKTITWQQNQILNKEVKNEQ